VPGKLFRLHGCKALLQGECLVRFFYSLMFYLAVPLVIARLLWRSLKEPGYRRQPLQRFGFYQSPNSGDVIWIHAVSAGETIAMVPLVERLIASGRKCLVTNMTPTGRERVAALLGDSVENCYMPYDLPGSVSRFIRKNRPRLLVIIDTELWPNTLSICKRRGIKVALVNGRMSNKSALGYERIAALVRPMMEGMDLCAVQTEQHGLRFAGLGVRAKNLFVTGSLKFDAQYAKGHDSRLEKARKMTEERTVLVGASTHEGEEEALLNVLSALRNVVSDVILVLAPRHTHRCDQVARLIQSMGYAVAKFSDGTAPGPECSVLLLDVMGELEPFYGVARLAFVGGSLVPRGGHNLLEAVRAGVPVIMGPHLHNIDDIAAQFVDKEAMRVVHTNSELADEVIGFMRDKGKARAMAMKATAVLEENRGALSRVVQLLDGLLDRAPG
jgi:3-deoxy-D-manno-octulosonic-acid transferase